ncbi:hypothetical protein N6H14_14750 [Paenibacillus sp. CC-CFT747]|nr:hypothetical protein N6H14_14750 [Paenibacillus sp. CC-CFT747]
MESIYIRKASWKAFLFKRIVEYYLKVNGETKCSPREALPELELLKDDQLLTKKYSTVEAITSRLLENAQKVERMQRGDEEDRQDALRTLRTNAEDEVTRKELQRIYSAFLKITRSDFSVLPDVTVDDISRLLSAKKLESPSAWTRDAEGTNQGEQSTAADDDEDTSNGDGDKQPNDYTTNDDNDDTSTAGGSRATGTQRRSYSSLSIAAIMLTLEGHTSLLTELLEAAVEQLRAESSFNTNELVINHEHLSVTVRFDPSEAAIAIMRSVVGASRYGGVLDARDKESSFNDILMEFGRFSDLLLPYDEVRLRSLVEYMNRAQGISKEFIGAQLLEEYIEKRRGLLELADMLAVSPLACLLTSPDNRARAREAIESYERLLGHMDKQYYQIKRRSSEGASFYTRKY